jgi:hypothetical protein
MILEWRFLGAVVLTGVLLSACRPAEQTEPSVAIDDASPPAPDVIPVEQEPTPVEAPPADVQTWRFTTLVTGGTEAFDRLIGTNGYYELVVEGEQATVRKVGQKGTPVFADEEIQTGMGTLVSAANSEWPAAARWTLEVELASGGTDEKRPLVFDLWFFADELHGSWAAPNSKDDAHVGDTWGLVQGRRDAGEPLEIRDGAHAPCMICARAFWNCDGLSFDEPACNSAEMSWSKCEARLEKALEGAAEVPRGCDDPSM